MGQERSSKGPSYIQSVQNTTCERWISKRWKNAEFRSFVEKNQDCRCWLHGDDILTEDLAKIGAQVTGIDVSAELINIAKKHVKLDPDISQRVIHRQARKILSKKKRKHMMLL